ncbi:LOW QUALITY PROTEIN: hypothetical protein HID58_032204 [Brassica napus]|uniref:FBD domain-containing protein n=2 Tax=Brassica napus TaxID=3708 RepID=A0ABQ8BVU1_BRANA|nr:LOW QUALITY PROTEIN: hypothetical protein HID58_032204 [Brassica napus]
MYGQKKDEEDKIISGFALSDDLLVKILTCLPTRVAASTSVFGFGCQNSGTIVSSVMESFHLVLFGSSLSTKDIETWLATALSRNLCELFLINEYSNEKPNILPSRLYTCKSLVVLRLRGEIRLDVPRLSRLPSLKTLELILDKYDKGLITSLHSETEGVLPRGLVIDSPSLKYLKLRDRHQWSRPGFSIETMPDLEEAYVNVQYYVVESCGLMAPTTSIERLIRSITSVKRLTICSEMRYTGGFVFNQLEHLKLCVCGGDSSNLLARLLEDSPNVRVLDIFEIDHDDRDYEELISTVRTVRESVLSNLQTFNWSRYFERRPQEMDLAVYILGEKWSLKDCNNLV